MLPEMLKGYLDTLFSPLFCIYAVASWRRKHEGGSWKWKTVFADICESEPNHPHIEKIQFEKVRKILSRWQGCMV